MSSPTVRPITNSDRDWVRAFICEQWGDEIMVAHGDVFRPHEHAGFVSLAGDEPIGLITYRIHDGACEVLSLDSLQEGEGIGTALMNAVVTEAQRTGCTRVWLITTNDNLNALRFYQKRGFALVAVHRNAATRARALKPSIPLIGEHGIPLRDEIELERMLV